MKVFAALSAVGPLLLIACGDRNTSTHKRGETSKLIVAVDALRGDTYEAYKTASKEAEEALTFAPGSARAHAIAAYAHAIRWTEHGGDQECRQRAIEHIAAAKALATEPLPHLLAAEALMRAASGNNVEAIFDLQQAANDFKDQGARPSLLYLTLGLLQSDLGDLDGARLSLESAQDADPDHPRICAALGTLSRRQGRGGEALNHFTVGLMHGRGTHADSLMGTALLILDVPGVGGGYLNAADYLERIIEMRPEVSPKQMATAHMARALLISRASRDAPHFIDAQLKDQVWAAVGITEDPAATRAEILKEDKLAMRAGALSELLLIRATRLFYEGRYAAAAAEIRTAIAMNPEKGHYRAALARVLQARASPR